jgi:hypothetical protein
MFESQVAKPQASGGSNAAQDSSSEGGGGSSEQLHTNCIMCVTPVGSAGSAAAAGRIQFLTSGLDGKVVEWQIDGL